MHYLQDIDQVLCKTHTAEKSFEGRHPDVRYLGFSTQQAEHTNLSTDRGVDISFLHVAGTSPLKGTTPVLQSWLRHPEWPILTLVADQVELPNPIPGNIRPLSRVTNQEMQELWRTATFAVMPSEAEGFGQILIEAMVNGAVAITTDAPPMNELIRPERGYLVPYSSEKRCRLGKRYLVSDRALEDTIERILTVGQDEWNTKTANAARWVATNHEQFVQRVRQLLEEIQQRQQESLDK
ncbi:glycosyltransferase [Marinobacter flavimaris]|uniref:glycosyltransferase n=1 Tax=Marinobacter flavimaris TaxID=262076 RepID=UPI0038701AE8